MRSKEQAHDYRYFPEPDLPPLIVSRGISGRDRRAKLPELPEARRARMIAEYELNRQGRGHADRDARVCRPL